MRNRVLPLMFLLSVSRVLGAPSIEKEAPPEKIEEVGKLAFSLADSDTEKEDSEAGPWAFVTRLFSRSDMIASFIKYFRYFTGSALKEDDEPNVKKANPTARAQGVRTMNLEESLEDVKRQQFEASLSLDDSVKTAKAADHKSISDEEWASTLFGEKGILTALFHFIDERRRGLVVQSDATDKINGKPLDLDFAKIFDSLLDGSAKGAQFGDPSPVLPEFLGICNRLSCGDIYKAIDQFRRSEFFSNFQTALQLIQDPKGWNIIGDLLSNPELIASFTSNSPDLEKVFGSAIASKSKSASKSDITPEDGDIGEDLTDMAEGRPKPKKLTAEELPEVALSVDGPESSDYYSAVDKEPVDKDEAVDKEMPFEEGEIVTPVLPTLKTTEAPKALPDNSESVDFVDVDGPPLPLTSLSIDETPEDSATYEKSVDASVPPTGTVINTLSRREAKVRSGGVMRTQAARTSTTSDVWMATRLHTTTTTVSPTLALTTLKKITFIFTTTTQRPTTKNPRKDNDYYAMYYDDVRS